MIYFLTFISFVIFQRIGELFWAKRNARILFSSGAYEVDKSGYRYIVVMHIFFFISILSEYFLLRRGLAQIWYAYLVLFLLAQVLRYWSIASLGKFWNTRIIILPGAEKIRKGPYRFISHPNYAAVIIELAIIPLMFGCFLTASVFSLLNLILLARRIKIENRELEKLN